MHPSALCGTLVGVVEATEDRDRADRPRTTRQLQGGRLGERLAEALVRPRPVEVRDVLAQHVGEVALPEDEQMIEAFAAHAAQEPLAGGIGLRRAVWRAQDRDASGC